MQTKEILSDLASPYVDLLLVHEPYSYWPDPAHVRTNICHAMFHLRENSIIGALLLDY